MIARQVAHIIAVYVLFLETTDEDNLNLDTAVEMMETLSGQLAELDKGFLRELVDAFPVIAPEYSEEGQIVVRDIPEYFGLEEVLSGEDPG